MRGATRGLKIAHSNRHSSVEGHDDGWRGREKASATKSAVDLGVGEVAKTLASRSAAQSPDHELTLLGTGSTLLLQRACSNISNDLHTDAALHDWKLSRSSQRCASNYPGQHRSSGRIARKVWDTGGGSGKFGRHHYEYCVMVRAGRCSDGIASTSPPSVLRSPLRYNASGTRRMCWHDRVFFLASSPSVQT